MNILVTGGAGFIGSHVVDAYLDAGHRVVVIDNLSSGRKENLNPKAKFYQEDIRKSAVETIIAKEAIDILNHHAAQIDVRKSVADPLYDADVNILGSLNLFETSRKNKVKKIIFSSTGGAIYGDAEILPTPEDYSPPQPLSPYGVAKLSTEQYLSFYHQVYKLPFVALRYANVFGPRQDPHGEAGVVAIFIQKMLIGEQPIINGDGKQFRDFVYVGDVARANVVALKADFVGPVNIGTAKATNINQLFHLLRHLFGTNVPEKHGSPKAGEQRKSLLDTKLARTILDWEPKVPLEAGLKLTISYFRRNKGKIQ